MKRLWLHRPSILFHQPFAFYLNYDARYRQFQQMSLVRVGGLCFETRAVMSAFKGPHILISGQGFCPLELN